jgi:hypothetical protein
MNEDNEWMTRLSDDECAKLSQLQGDQVAAHEAQTLGRDLFDQSTLALIRFVREMRQKHAQ